MLQDNLATYDAEDTLHAMNRPEATPKRRGCLALLEIEAGSRCLPHAAQLPAMQSVLFAEDSGAIESA